MLTRQFMCSFISRVRKTVLGSAEDIGWLQRAMGMPPVKDGTERFMELLHNIRLDHTADLKFLLVDKEN